MTGKRIKGKEKEEKKEGKKKKLLFDSVIRKEYNNRAFLLDREALPIYGALLVRSTFQQGFCPGYIKY